MKQRWLSKSDFQLINVEKKNAKEDHVQAGQASVQQTQDD
jgi:hypothetical protein